MLWLWVAAPACTNPISNLPFYEDAELVAALPSEDRFGVPRSVRLARVGTSPVLADAVAASAELQDIVETLFRSGEVLRVAEPDVRSDVGRSWDAVQAVGDLGGERFTWWVRGEVLRVAEGSDATWVIEVAPEESGPYRPVGEGRHDPGGYGDGTWDLAAIVDVLEDQSDSTAGAAGVLSFDYEDELEGSDEVRVVTLQHTLGADLLGTWTAVGDVALAWFGQSNVTDPARPAAFQVITDDNGGWGLGELYEAEDTLTLTTCWSPVGDTVYAEGTALDPELGAQVAETGTDSDCPTSYPF